MAGENDDDDIAMKLALGAASLAAAVVAFWAGRKMDQAQDRHETKQTEERARIILEMVKANIPLEDAERILNSQVDKLSERSLENRATKEILSALGKARETSLAWAAKQFLPAAIRERQKNRE